MIYIEPYPKSKAEEFCQVEITCSRPEKEKVQFAPFYGVAPHRFVDLFSMKSTRWRIKKRKDDNGDEIPWEQGEASLRNPMPLLTYLENEGNAALHYREAVSQMKGEGNGRAEREPRRGAEGAGRR